MMNFLDFFCKFSTAFFIMLIAQNECHGFGMNTENFKGRKSYTKMNMLVEAPEGTPPLVILPGFGNDQIDYKNPLERGEEYGLETALSKRGFQSFVVPVNRSDWLKVARGIISPSFWKRELKPEGPCYNWYLDKVAETVAEAAASSETGTVVLVGHSAGGWLARAALGDGSESDCIQKAQLAACTEGLITLGSPHFPPAPPVDDMTFGCLSYVDKMYPGSFLRDQGLFYITVAGDVVYGIEDAEPRSIERYAFGSYTAVCGSGDVTGDSVVPLQSAHLSDANQITLPNIYHSINNPVWYGSDGVVDLWLEPMIKSLQRKKVVQQSQLSFLQNSMFQQLVGSIKRR